MQPRARTHVRPISGIRFVCLLALPWFTTNATAADNQEIYRERLEFDPATNQWVAIAPPIPGTEEGDLALARLHLARTRYVDAREAFKEWRKKYPQSSKWSEALFYSAQTEISAEDAKPRGGDLIKAYEWLNEIVQGWPGTDLSERSMRKILIIAEMLLFKDRKQKVWKGVLHLSAQEEALQMLDRLIDDYARETPIAEQALRLKADYHYQAGEFEDAEKAYARLMREFARGRYARISHLRAGQSALAQFPGADFDDADLLEAEVYLADFAQKYPGEAAPNNIPELLSGIKESRAEKDFRVARYYERVSKGGAAAFYYRSIVANHPETSWAAQARERLNELGATTSGPPPVTIESPPEPATSSLAGE